jgi:excinuclease ABC subunit B
MARAVEETNRRREIQSGYNERYGITPETIRKEIRDMLDSVYERDYVTVPVVEEEAVQYRTVEDMDRQITEIEKRMKKAADRLEFEEAARLRDQAQKLREERLILY